MSYAKTLGFIPAVVEGATFCPNAYVVRAAGANPTCFPECPPDWIVTREGGDDICTEPTDQTTLAEGCAGRFMLMEPDKGYSYCADVCPSGWKQSTSQGIKMCEKTAGAPGPAAAAQPSVAPSAAAPAEAAQAAVGLGELPWWAYAAGGAVLLGAAAYYAWG